MYGHMNFSKQTNGRQSILTLSYYTLCKVDPLAPMTPSNVLPYTQRMHRDAPEVKMASITDSNVFKVLITITRSWYFISFRKSCTLHISYVCFILTDNVFRGYTIKSHLKILKNLCQFINSDRCAGTINVLAHSWGQNFWMPFQRGPTPFSPWHIVFKLTHIIHWEPVSPWQLANIAFSWVKILPHVNFVFTKPLLFSRELNWLKLALLKILESLMVIVVISFLWKVIILLILRFVTWYSTGFQSHLKHQ